MRVLLSCKSGTPSVTDRVVKLIIIIIIIITGATGTISKLFRKYVSTIPGNHEVKELQNTATLGTVHRVWCVGGCVLGVLLHGM
jgi:hypothetical protein